MSRMMKTTLAAATFAACGMLATTAIAQDAGAQQPVSESVSARTVLFSSSLWIEKSEEATGAYTITENNGSRFIELSSDFKTKNAPDLKLVLSPHNPEDATKRNALQGGVIVSLLRSNTGAQRYELPQDVDLSRFNSVLIHCEQYTKLWSAAPLSEGEVIARSDDWDKKTKKTRGAWEIAQTDSGRYLRFAGDFKTSKAPEPLRIVFSPLTPELAKNKNALDGGVVIGTTGQYKGAQQHRLPDDLDLSRYNALLLHCEKYVKLWSASGI